MKQIKKPISLALALVLLVTTFLFTNIFSVTALVPKNDAGLKCDPVIYVHGTNPNTKNAINKLVDYAFYGTRIADGTVDSTKNGNLGEANYTAEKYTKLYINSGYTISEVDFVNDSGDVIGDVNFAYGKVQCDTSEQQYYYLTGTADSRTQGIRNLKVTFKKGDETYTQMLYPFLTDHPVEANAGGGSYGDKLSGFTRKYREVRLVTKFMNSDGYPIGTNLTGNYAFLASPNNVSTGWGISPTNVNDQNLIDRTDADLHVAGAWNSNSTYGYAVNCDVVGAAYYFDKSNLSSVQGVNFEGDNYSIPFMATQAGNMQDKSNTGYSSSASSNNEKLTFDTSNFVADNWNCSSAAQSVTTFKPCNMYLKGKLSDGTQISSLTFAVQHSTDNKVTVQYTVTVNVCDKTKARNAFNQYSQTPYMGMCYTDATWANYQNYLKKISAYVNNYKNTDETVQTQITNDFIAAYNSLVLKEEYQANYTQLNAEIVATNTLKDTADFKNNLYKSESVALMNTALTNAVNVDRNLTIDSQSVIDDLALKLKAARESLQYIDADYTVVNTALAKVPKDLSVYTKATVDALNSVINSVEYNLNIKNQTKVNGFASDIEKAITNLVLADADYTQLDLSISKKPLYASDFYTEQSWSNYQTALNSAKAVSRTLKATEQSIINGAKNALDTAYTNLQLKNSDYTNVNKAIASASALNSNYYTNWSVVQTALDNVKTGYDITRQDEVNSMAEAINSAISQLIEKNADYTAVETAKSQIPTDLTIYTTESVNALNTVLDSIVYDLKISQQSVVNSYATSINNAVKNLVIKSANYTVVDDALKQVPKDMSIYTSESVERVNNAINLVDRTLDASKQNLVNQMAEDILFALSCLELKDADYTLVNKLLNDIQQLNESDYSNFEILEPAVNNVKFGYKIDKQSEVNQMAEVLKQAIESLKRIIKTTVNVNGNGYVMYNDNPINDGYVIGTDINSEVVITAVGNNNSKFAYWIDGSNRIVSQTATLKITTMYSTSYTAVFDNVESETANYKVTFLGKNGAVLSIQSVAEGESAVAPSIPVYVGYTFTGWSGDYNNVIMDCVVRANYTPSEVGYTITKQNDEINVIGFPQENGRYTYNSKVVFTLSDYSTFAGWSIDGGKTIISYDKEYALYVGMNIEITYVTKAPDDSEPVPQPIVSITDVTIEDADVAEKVLVAIMVERNAPDDSLTLVSAGLIFTKTEKDLTIESADLNGDVYLRTTNSTQTDGQYRLTLKMARGEKLRYRGYAVYKDADNQLITIYTDVNSLITPLQ